MLLWSPSCPALCWIAGGAAKASLARVHETTEASNLFSKSSERIIRLCEKVNRVFLWDYRSSYVAAVYCAWSAGLGEGGAWSKGQPEFWFSFEVSVVLFPVNLLPLLDSVWLRERLTEAAAMTHRMLFSITFVRELTLLEDGLEIFHDVWEQSIDGVCDICGRQWSDRCLQYSFSDLKGNKGWWLTEVRRSGTEIILRITQFRTIDRKKVKLMNWSRIYIYIYISLYEILLYFCSKYYVIDYRMCRGCWRVSRIQGDSWRRIQGVCAHPGRDQVWSRLPQAAIGDKQAFGIFLV